eukprot:GDKI01040605.1.p1 GENE.GDKI01040605.1~~GDKI01040605.1.p1  ORF type:complete len:240 (-),score=43.84 GDKI01040605.1:400-1119(-)
MSIELAGNMQPGSGGTCTHLHAPFIERLRGRLGRIRADVSSDRIKGALKGGRWVDALGHTCIHFVCTRTHATKTVLASGYAYSYAAPLGMHTRTAHAHILCAACYGHTTLTITLTLHTHTHTHTYTHYLKGAVNTFVHAQKLTKTHSCKDTHARGKDLRSHRTGGRGKGHITKTQHFSTRKCARTHPTCFGQAKRHISAHTTQYNRTSPHAHMHAPVHVPCRFFYAFFVVDWGQKHTRA